MRESTIRDVVEKTIRHAGAEGVIFPEPVDTRRHYGSTYEDIPKRIPDTAKAERVLGWRLETDLDEGIRRTIAWALANPWYLEDAGEIRR
jgi:UDP-glucose 4-epimerase